MDNFIKDFEIACFIFCGFIGLLLFWHLHNINASNHQKAISKEDEAEFSPSESSQENEAALNSQEQSTNQSRGGRE